MVYRLQSYNNYAKCQVFFFFEQRTLHLFSKIQIYKMLKNANLT